MLTKEIIIGSREVLADGQIQCRYDTFIYEDGELISGPAHWREVIHPGQDVSDKDPAIQRIALAEHTPEVVAAWVAEQAARRAEV